MTPTVGSLRAVADWNLTRGLELLRQEPHVKTPSGERDHDSSKDMLRSAGRHLRNHDDCTRQAWLLEHTKTKGRKT